MGLSQCWGMRKSLGKILGTSTIERDCCHFKTLCVACPFLKCANISIFCNVTFFFSVFHLICKSSILSN